MRLLIKNCETNMRNKCTFQIQGCFTILLCLCHVVAAEVDEKRLEEAIGIASATTVTFISLYDNCLDTSMANMDFSLDNMQKFIAQPARTTVGFMTKYTTNRRFFANLLASPAFKEMLGKDEDEVRKKFIQKMKYCDKAIMDENLLRDFYDKEVDQSRI